MTDNEIIKALECYRGQVLFTFNGKKPEIYIHDIIDLINRQKAEIEQHKNTIAEIQSEISILRDANENLQGMCLREKTRVEKAKEKCIYFAKEVEKARTETDRVTALAAEWKDAAYTYADSIDRVKTEAIKEFAERLKEHACCYDLPDYHSFSAVDTEDIDNLVKEMVGEG